MAALGGNSLKRKLTDTEQQRVRFRDRLKDDIVSCINKLNGHEHKSLHFKQTNAAFGHSFSDATCDAEEGKRAFTFWSIYHRGLDVLKSFFGVDCSTNVEMKTEEVLAMDVLMNYLIRLQDDDPTTLKPQKDVDTDVHWTLQTCHHLMKDLTRKDDYTVDHHAKYLGAVDLSEYGCPCCKKRLTGSTGDTFIGNENVWHGQVDALLGPVAIVHPTSDRRPVVSHFNTPEKMISLGQLAAQAVVFSFIQKNANSYNLTKFLVPTVEISRNALCFYWYDCVLDIFLMSSTFELFETNEKCVKLKMETVIALWLTLNYPLFCTGVVDTMLKTNVRANFLQPLPKRVKNTYKHEVRVGAFCKKNNQHQHPPAQPVEYQAPIDGAPVEYEPSVHAPPAKKAKVKHQQDNTLEVSSNQLQSANMIS